MRLSPPEFLSLAAWHTVPLLTEESSISVRIACKSSEAEITGNSRTSRHPIDARHWSELNLRVPRRHSQYAGSANSSHTRLSNSSIAAYYKKRNTMTNKKLVISFSDTET
jgi:hypothetical protein